MTDQEVKREIAVLRKLWNKHTASAPKMGKIQQRIHQVEAQLKDKIEELKMRIYTLGAPEREREIRQKLLFSKMTESQRTKFANDF